MLKILKSLTGAVFFCLCFLTIAILLGVMIIEHYFPDTTFNQMFFHALYIDGEQLSFYYTEIAGVFFISLLAAVIIYKWPLTILIFALFFYRAFNQPIKVSDIEVDKEISLRKQILLSLQWSDIYERYYKISSLQKPKKPKNIILIFAESIEDNFSDENYWGENLIPYLSVLKKEGVSFRGYKSINGTNWTIASNVATFCGVPIRVHLRDLLGPQTEHFLPGAECLPDMLHKVGYHNVFSTGTYISFVGTDVFIKEHHFDEVFGRDELIEQNFASDDDIGLEEYGINDTAMFEFARKKISELSSRRQPFFISIQTLDTHFPSGYVHSSCETKYGDTRDAIKCSDKIIYDFIKWCQNQDFYADTTIIIVGDHLMMTSSDIAEQSEVYPQREIYSVILEQNIKPQTIFKPYSMFDWSATIADKAGIISGPYLGLGVSLLRNDETLAERLGAQKLEEEVLKNSGKYNELLGINL